MCLVIKKQGIHFFVRVMYNVNEHKSDFQICLTLLGKFLAFIVLEIGGGGLLLCCDDSEQGISRQQEQINNISLINVIE